MFYTIGLLRSTSLYAVIISIITLILRGKENINNIALYVAFIYPIIVLIHQIILRVKNKSDYSFLENYFSSLFSDIAAPFRHFVMFFLVITKKHIIKDKNKFYNMLDLFEVIAGFICTLIIIVLAIISIF